MKTMIMLLISHIDWIWWEMQYQYAPFISKHLCRCWFSNDHVYNIARKSQCPITDELFLELPCKWLKNASIYCHRWRRLKIWPNSVMSSSATSRRVNWLALVHISLSVPVWSPFHHFHSLVSVHFVLLSMFLQYFKIVIKRINLYKVCRFLWTQKKL